MTATEDTHTPPRPDCPHPELWTAPDQMASEIEVGWFLAALIQLTKPLVVAETGCYLGHTSWQMGYAMHEQNRGILHTCDIHPKAVDITGGRCVGLPVIVHQCRGVELRNFTQPHTIDLAFIDSTPDGHAEELHVLRPRYAVLHDTGTHRPSVRHEADTFPDYRAIHFDTPRGVSLLQRR